MATKVDALDVRLSVLSADVRWMNRVGGAIVVVMLAELATGLFI